MRHTATKLAISASLLSVSVVLAGTAHADAAADATAAKPDTTPEIVVTGSLIRRPNNTSASPIVTVSDHLIKQSGQASLEDALNQLPDFTVSGNAATGGQGGGGRATISLHGLGQG